LQSHYPPWQQTLRLKLRVYKTLSHKAEISCETPGRVPVSIKRYEKLCTQDLLEDFVFDIGNESLTRYHENRIQ